MKIPNRFADAGQQLHDQATAETGLSDFGDNSYIEALDVLLHAYDSNTQFSNLGRFAAFTGLVNCLKGRLYSRQGINQQPQCLDNAIHRPVFIVGLPRTGTTILHRLLAQAPDCQGLEYWLGSYPTPRPPRNQWGDYASYREVCSSLDMLDKINPELKAIHEMSAEGVDECRLLLMHCFANVSFQSNATVPDYEAWLYQANFEAAYRYYRECLQLIGSTSPHRRWVLKDPSHMWAMDTLLDTFPDAIIVQTHRDPVKLIPSVSSLVLSARRMQEPEVSAAAVGRQQLRQFSRVLKKIMAVRERRPQHFVDVYFDEFLADPLAVVETIYRHMDQAFEPELARQLTQWMARNPQGKHGSHHYTSADFGLTDKGIGDEFAQYKAHFGV